jgi:hypothetical protein
MNTTTLARAFAAPAAGVLVVAAPCTGDRGRTFARKINRHIGGCDSSAPRRLSKISAGVSDCGRWVACWRVEQRREEKEETMKTVKRRVQVLILAILGTVAVQPGVLAWMMSCEEFIDLAWDSASEACQRDYGTDILSQECECNEDGNGNLTYGICFAICEPRIE